MEHKSTKRLLSLLLTVLMVVSMFPSSAFALEGGDVEETTTVEEVTGSPADAEEPAIVPEDNTADEEIVFEETPIIATAMDGTPVAQIGETKYADLHEALVDCKEGETVELLSDVALTGEWTPVTEFAGTFNGNKYTISGLTITTGTGNLGLFGSCSDATIKNVTISGASISGSTMTGSNIAVVAGCAGTSTFENVTVTNATVDTTGKYVGGIVGTSSSTIKNCTVSGSTIKGKDQVGGIAGYQWCNGLISCTSTNNTITASEERAGGIAGKMQLSAGNDSFFQLNENTVDGVTVTAPDYAGGLVAQLHGDTLNYEAKNNRVKNITLTAKETNPIGVLRPFSEGAINTTWTAALAANVTGNGWDDSAYDSDIITYTAVGEGVAAQVINNATPFCFYKDDSGIYHIANLEGLKKFRDVINDDSLDYAVGATFQLDSDIDLNGETWAPIWVDQNHDILFDGNGHKISNFVVNVEGHAGLFASAATSTIKNLTVENANVTGTNHVAAIAGYGICAKIENCKVYNSVVTTLVDATPDNGDKAGAICGYLSGESNAWVKNCTVDNCTIRGYRDIGGAVGMANKTATVTGNTVTNTTVINDQEINYKNYTTNAEFDANKVVGEITSTSTVIDNTAGDDVVVIIANKKVDVDTDKKASVTEQTQITKVTVDDKVISDETTKAAVETKTTVTGVKLSDVPTVEVKGSSDITGLQAVVDAAVAKDKSTIAEPIKTAETVSIEVKVNVTPTKYEAPAEGTTEGTVAFKLEPEATVTVGTGSEAKSEIVTVTNDMIDQDQNIKVEIYTGFEPSLIVHVADDSSKTYYTKGTYASDSTFAYNADTGVATFYVHHFSDVWVYQETKVASITKNSTTTYYNTLAEALLAAESADTIEVLDGTWGAEAIGTIDNSVVRYKSLNIKPATDANVTFTSTLNIGYEDSSTSNATMNISGFAFKDASLYVCNYVQASVTNCTFNGSYNGGENNAALVIKNTCCTNHKSSGDYPTDQATVSGCTFNNTVSQAICMFNTGNATVTNNTITNAGHNGIGFQTNYSNSGIVTITGNTITEWNASNASGQGRAMRLALGTLAEGSTVTVTGNTFRKTTLGLDVPDFAKITGTGSATVDLSDNDWNDELLSTIKGNSSYYTCDATTTTISSVVTTKKEPTVCKIGETEYSTLEAAVAAVQNNETITLIDNITYAKDEQINLTGTKTFTLDLNGKAISGQSETSSFYFFNINTGINLTVKDSSGDNSGKITFNCINPDPSYSKESCTVYNCGGTLTLQSGTIENTTTTGLTYAVNNSSNAWANPITSNFNMTGGIVTAPNGDAALRVYQNAGAQVSENYVNISGGTILDTGIFVDTVTYQPAGTTTDNSKTKTEINISGDAVINGLLDFKLRNDKISATISGGTFNNCSFRVRNYTSESIITGFTAPIISITGGKFAFKADGEIFASKDFTTGVNPYAISGGLFNTDGFDVAVASGYEIVDNTTETKTEYPYTIGEAAKVATVKTGDTTTVYYDLNDALKAGKESGSVVTLLADVDLTGKAWTPVAGFNGTFDGANKTISGLTVTGEGSLGLFAGTGTNATIKDLTISGATINGKGDMIGVLAGGISGSAIENVTITGSTVSGNAYVGGLCGSGYPAASNCTITSNTITGKDQVGGMIGYIWVGHVENCTVTGNTVTATSERAGGLAGKIQIAAGNLGSSTMWFDGNTVTGTVSAPDYTGGIAAQIMGDVDYYSIKNNDINVTTAAGSKGVHNPIGNLRDSQNAAFTGALAKNITGNWWEDETLNADSFQYTNVASGVEAQTIYRGVATVSDGSTSKAYKSLAKAIAAVPTDRTETTITMIADETFAENAGVTIAKTQNVVLDLNGHKIGNNITVAAASATITNYGTLEICDSSEGASGIITNGVTEDATGDWWSSPRKNWTTNTITNCGVLTLTSGTIQNTATGISYCVDNNSNGVPATFNMNGGKLEDIGCAMRMFCNTTAYQNTFNMTAGTIESKNSIAFWVQFPSSGKELATVNISGGTLLGNGYSWYDYSYGTTLATDNASYSITGGNFKGIIMSQGKTGFISGGLFTSLEYYDSYDKATYKLSDYVASGRVIASNTDEATKTDYPYTVAKAVASVTSGETTTYFATLEATVAAAESGDEIKLLADLTDTGAISLPANVTLNGQGHEISGNSCVYINAAGGTVKNVEFNNISNGNNLTAIYGTNLSGAATVTGCTFNGWDWDAIQITPVAGASIDINGNTFNATSGSNVNRAVHVQSAKNVDFSCKVNGNKFTGCTYLNNTGIEVYYPADASKLDCSGNYMDSPMAVCIGTGNSYNNATEKAFPFKDENLENNVSVVASIRDANGNDYLYTTLADAIAAANKAGSGTIIMIGDTTFTFETDTYATINAGTNVTIDINGKKVMSGSKCTSGSQLFANKGTLTIKDSAESSEGYIKFGANPVWIYDGSGNYNGSYASNLITNAGTVTIESGYLENLATDSYASYVVDNNSTTAAPVLNVTGGTIKGRVAIRQFANSATNANTVNISGGTVEGTRNAVLMQCSPSNKSCPATLNVSNGTLICTTSGKGIIQYWDEAYANTKATKLKVNITGGKFSGDTVIELDPANITDEVLQNGIDISGGIYRVIVGDNYIANGYYATENTDSETVNEYPYAVYVAPTKPVVDESTVVINENETDKTVSEASEKAKEVVKEIKNNEAVSDPEASNVQDIVTSTDPNTDSSLKIELKSVAVTTTAAESETFITTDTVKYDVKPIFVITDSEGKTTEQTVTNEELAEMLEKAGEKAVTFRLAVPTSMTGDYVTVSHYPASSETPDWTKVFEVQTDETTSAHYVELSASSFSEYVVKYTSAESYVAKNADTGAYYTTVAKAIAEAASGETVALLANSAEKLTIDANDEIILDLNGKQLTNSRFTNNGTLTIKDSSKDVDGLVKCNIINNGTISIVSGQFRYEPENEWIAITSKVEKSGSYYKVTVDESIVASVNNEKFTDIQDAVDAAQDGGTVKVLKNIEEATVNVNSGYNVTIDLNGNNLCGETSDGDAYIYNRGTLTLTGEGVVKGKIVTNGTTYITGGKYDVDFTGSGKVQISGGMFTEEPTADQCAAGYGTYKTTDETYKWSVACAVYEIETATKAGDQTSIASVSGAGEYAAGSTVTLTAYNTTGYIFDHWEYNGENVSTSATYTFTATRSGVYTAVYTVDTNAYFKLTVNAANTEIKVADASQDISTIVASKEYGNVYNREIDINKSVVVTYVTSDGESFLYWATENGVILSRTAEYSFTMNSHKTLVAYTTSNSKAGSTVVYTNGTGQVISSRYYEKPATGTVAINQPRVNPTAPGFTFNGWLLPDGETEATDTTINALLGTDKNQFIVISPKWDKIEGNILVTVKYEGVEQEDEIISIESSTSTGIYPVVEDVEGTAMFDHWEINGKTAGYNRTYYLYSVEDIVITAVYTKNGPETVTPTISMVNFVRDINNNYYQLISRLSMEVTNGCTFVGKGVIRSKTTSEPEKLTLSYVDNDNIKKSEISGSNIHSYYVLNTTSPDTVWNFRAYLTYTDANGTEHTVYSDVYSGSYNSLGE